MADKLYNKIIYGGKTLIDLTGDTVTAATLLSGTTAHGKSGAVITGSCKFDSDTTDANAAAAEILSGRTAYVNKVKVIGSMPNRGGVTGTIATIDGTYTIQNGYHDGSGKVSIASEEKAKIIASNLRKGITILGVEGTMTGTEEVVAGSTTVTPSTSQQVITPNSEQGENYLAQVTVLAIPYTETENSAGGLTVTIS